MLSIANEVDPFFFLLHEYKTCVLYVIQNMCFSNRKFKKQQTVSISSVEVKYKSMAMATCEIVWILYFLKDIQVNHEREI